MPIKIYESDIIRRDKPAIKIMSALRSIEERVSKDLIGKRFRREMYDRVHICIITQKNEIQFLEIKNSCEIICPRP